MNKLKNIYRLLLILPFITLVSCDTDEDYSDLRTNGTTIIENTVFIDTDNVSTEAKKAITGKQYDVAAAINDALADDVIITFTVTKDGDAAVLNTDYTLSDVVIASGEKSNVAQVAFLMDGLYEISIDTVDATSLKIVKNSLKFDVGAPFIKATWDDDYYDYDLYLIKGDQDLSGDLIDSSEEISNLERIAEPSFEEGKMSLYMYDYWGDNAGTPVTLEMYDGTTTTTFDVVMDQSKFVLVIETKVDADGNYSYEYTQL